MADNINTAWGIGAQQKISELKTEVQVWKDKYEEMECRCKVLETQVTWLKGKIDSYKDILKFLMECDDE